MLLFAYCLLSLILIWIVSKKNIRIPFSLIVVLAFFLRIFVTLIFLTSRSEDVQSFLIDGQYILSHRTNYHSNYFPFIGYLGVAALYFQSYIHPYIFLKIIFTIFDVAVLFPLYFLTKKNLQSVLIYALNPISIITLNIHGQMESIPLFFFLSGTLFFIRNRIVSSVLTLSFAIYTKPLPILFVMPLLKKSKKKLLFLLLGFFPLLLTFVHSLFFPISLLDIFEKVKNHRGIFGAWGLSKIALYFANYQLNPFIEQMMRRVFFVAFVVFSLFRSDKNILKTILITMLFLFVFTPTFGIQWFTWLVPFIIIVRPRFWRIFLIVVSIYMTFGFAWDAYQYFRDIAPIWNSVINRAGFLVWILIIVMFYQNVFYAADEGKKN